MTRVLVAEKIGASGIELLREHFDVDTAFDQDGFDLAARIGDYDGHLIRSATKLDADLLAKATNLQAIGRAGVGVDNVDVPAATKRGIVVANAPESNVVTAAEHTMALLLALARNVPQAHASLTGGQVGALEVLGRRADGQDARRSSASGASASSSPQRAQGFGMRVLAFDPYVVGRALRAARRREGRDAPTTSTPQADFITIHLPKTPETENWLDAEAFAKMQRRRPRAERRPRAADRRAGARGRAGLRQGRRRGARRLPLRADDRAARCSAART